MTKASDIYFTAVTPPYQPPPQPMVFNWYACGLCSAIVQDQLMHAKFHEDTDWIIIEPEWDGEPR